jgi:hypothetical protein
MSLKTAKIGSKWKKIYSKSNKKSQSQQVAGI